MDEPDLTERALRIVEDALEVQGDERRILVEQRCAGDSALGREVESILAHSDSSGDRQQHQEGDMERSGSDGESAQPESPRGPIGAQT